MTATLPERGRCPLCGARLVKGFRPADTRDGDVDPFAYCTSQTCTYSYD